MNGCARGRAAARTARCARSAGSYWISQPASQLFAAEGAAVARIECVEFIGQCRVGLRLGAADAAVAIGVHRLEIDAVTAHHAGGLDGAHDHAGFAARALQLRLVGHFAAGQRLGTDGARHIDQRHAAGGRGRLLAPGSAAGEQQQKTGNGTERGHQIPLMWNSRQA